MHTIFNTTNALHGTSILQFIVGISIAVQALERLIKPAVYGVENVLLSALEIATLEKVIVTSSVAAVAGKPAAPMGYTYTEADWNEVATDTYLPYNRQYSTFLKKVPQKRHA